MSENTNARVSKTEAAALAGVHKRTIQRWGMSGRITMGRDFRTGKPWFLRSELESVRNGQGPKP